MTSCSALSRLCTWHVQTIGIATSSPVAWGIRPSGTYFYYMCAFCQLSTLFSLAGRPIPVEGKSLACLIGMEYRIIILIIMISLGQIFYHILQTHHACACTCAPPARIRAYTYAHTACAFTHVRTHTACACTHSGMCARTRANTHTVVVTVRRTGYRYSVSPNRDGLLRL